MKKISISPRFIKLTATLMSVVMLITACGINLICYAATVTKPEMYLGFTGEKDSASALDGVNTAIDHSVVDNYSPDGKAVAYTVTKGAPQFYVNLKLDNEEFNNLSKEKLKSMGCFFFWVSAPEGMTLGYMNLLENTAAGFAGDIYTYNTITGEYNKYEHYVNYSGFEGYVMIDLTTARYYRNWSGNYNLTWSDMVDAVWYNDKSNFVANMWHSSGSEDKTVVIDSIGVTTSVKDFYRYQRTRPLKTEPVTADVESGAVEKGTQVSLSAMNSSAEIYYTLDGTNPTTSETRKKYSSDTPIVVEDVTTLRAVAVASKNGEDRYSTISSWKYYVSDPDRVNTTVVNDASKLDLAFTNTTDSSIGIVEGMSPTDTAYKTLGYGESGNETFKFVFDENAASMDKEYLANQDVFYYWVSNSDTKEQNFFIRFNDKKAKFFGTIVTYNTITGKITTYKNRSSLTLSGFEGYIILKLQDGVIYSSGKTYSWHEYALENGAAFVTSAFKLADIYQKGIIWDDFAFAFGYDELIEELQAKPLRAAPPVADREDGPLENNTQIYLTTTTENADIYYTLDGTDPITSPTRIKYELIFMAAGLYDSPIRMSRAWDDLGIKPDANGNYYVKAVSVTEEDGKLVYSGVQTYTYTLEPIYDGEMDVIINNGDGTGSNKITYAAADKIDVTNGAEYVRGDTGETDKGLKLHVKKPSPDIHVISMGLDTSGCANSQGYNNFHNIKAISYRIQISGLPDGAYYMTTPNLNRESDGFGPTTYVISDDGKVRKNKITFENGSYTVVMLINDSTTVKDGWDGDFISFKKYCMKYPVTQLVLCIYQQYFTQEYDVIYDDFTAHFDSDALFKKLNIDGLMKDYDSGTYENSAMLVCNDLSGAKLNSGITEISDGLILATSDRSKDERCLAVGLNGKDSYISFGSYCYDDDAILCDGAAFWAEVPKGTGEVTLNLGLTDSDNGADEKFKYADTKWHYQIDVDGAVSRVYGKITLPDGFRGWVIIPGDNFHYVEEGSSFVNGSVDYEKLVEFTVSISGGSSLSGKTIYLDDISIYSSLESLIKAHAKSWKTTIN